jgi:DNA-binding MarR family transcriptional regulator
VDFKEIIIDIRKIVRSINLESKRILKDFGISIPQLLCLTYLKQQQGFQATHKELNVHLNLNSSTVTGIINRLEKKGLIARLPKKNDKRVTYIALTSAGYKILEHAPDLLQEKLTKNLKRLSPEKIQQVKTSLEILIDVLGIQAVDASPLLIVEDPNLPEE